MKTIAFIAISLASIFPNAAGATDLVFVKIPGIPGNSTYVGHPGEILASEFQHSIDRSNTTTPAIFSITKPIDRASPALAKAAGSTQVLPSITVTVRRTGEKNMD
ncbi:MAG: type VI secretion system tube protein Hcp [Opitutus sp.]